MTIRGTPRKFDYDQMGRDFDAGMTRAEIARKHGCSHHQASLAVARRNIRNTTPDGEMSEILTASFRKVMGYCPLADGPQDSDEAAA